MPSLEELKGQRILAQIKGLLGETETHAEMFRLVAIDTGGIWVESERFTKYILTVAKLSTTPKAPVLSLWHSLSMPQLATLWKFKVAHYPDCSTLDFVTN
jgi:hypothetical protein